jgi:cystathionine beta-lyase
MSLSPASDIVKDQQAVTPNALHSPALGADTVICHAGRDPAAHFGVVNPPVFHASTILFPTLEALDAKAQQKIRYGRRGTPTTFALEDAVSALEGAAGTVLTPSGSNAISTTLLAHAEPGAHVLIADNVYGPCRHCGEEVLRKLGVEVTYYDPLIGAGIAALIKPSTRLIWMEAPGSLTFEMPDVPAMIAVAKPHGIVTVVDNTWSGGLFFKPLALGADISVQAGTKYISGHSDVMLGTISCSEGSYERVKAFAQRLGICIGPDDAYLAQRGLRTIAVRMRQHNANALALAEWLANRPEVTRIMHPALPSDPNHALWKAHFTGASGLFGFVIRETDRRKLAAMLDGLQLFGMGSSWGGYESLLLPTDPRPLRSATTWSEPGQCMRVHVGLEDISDLITDLDKGFARLNG